MKLLNKAVVVITLVVFFLFANIFFVSGFYDGWDDDDFDDFFDWDEPEPEPTDFEEEYTSEPEPDEPDTGSEDPGDDIHEFDPDFEELGGDVSTGGGGQPDFASEDEQPGTGGSVPGSSQPGDDIHEFDPEFEELGGDVGTGGGTPTTTTTTTTTTTGGGGGEEDGSGTGTPTTTTTTTTTTTGGGGGSSVPICVKVNGFCINYECCGGLTCDRNLEKPTCVSTEQPIQPVLIQKTTPDCGIKDLK